MRKRVLGVTGVVVGLFVAVYLARGAEPSGQGELPKADAEGWISLFNGKDLSGWEGDPKLWKVENGYISAKAAKVNGNTFLIFKHPFSNFVLRAECMIIEAGKFPNSGIQYRSKVVDPQKWVVHGYQADAGKGFWGDLYDEGGVRKTLFKASKEATAAVKLDGWNQYEITAEGTHLKQVLNGVVAGEFDDKDPEHRAMSGVIALQYHAPGENFEVRFREVKIKVLK